MTELVGICLIISICILAAVLVHTSIRLSNLENNIDEFYTYNHKFEIGDIVNKVNDPDTKYLVIDRYRGGFIHRYTLARLTDGEIIHCNGFHYNLYQTRNSEKRGISID